MVPGFQMSFDMLLLYMNGKGEGRSGKRTPACRQADPLGARSDFLFLVKYRGKSVDIYVYESH